MTDELFDRVVVPVANPEDARTSAAAIQRYSSISSETIVGMYGIEKAGGAPDKAPVEMSEEAAAETFEALQDGLAIADVGVESRIVYGTDLTGAILETAADEAASAIVFTPRGGNQWVKLLTSDVTTELLEESHRPVVVLPDADRRGDES